MFLNSDYEFPEGFRSSNKVYVGQWVGFIVEEGKIKRLVIYILPWGTHYEETEWVGRVLLGGDSR